MAYERGVAIDEGGPEDRASIRLATSQNTWIRNKRRRERAPESMAEAERIARSKCPGITTRTLSSRYNCFGLVFGARRTAIFEDQVRLILADDGFQTVPRRADISPGDLVVYRSEDRGEIMHVGVVMKVEPDLTTGDVQVQVLSQWGFDGEYIHEESQVPPEYGLLREYLTERLSH